MPSAVGFDFDHTLGVDNKLERTVAMDLLAERASAASIPFDADTALAQVEATLKAYRHGEVTFSVAWTSLYQRLTPGGEPQGFLDEFIERCVRAVPSHVQMLPGARELLAALSERKIRYALLTNGWSPLQEVKAEAIGFEATVLVSERIGARKPQAAAFERLVSVLGVPAGDVLYVGDDPRTDIEGAQSAGLRGVWFDWENITYPADGAKPDHTIHALPDVLTLL